MGRYTPSSIPSGFGANTAINAEFDKIKDAIDDTLSRTGDSPNQMQADLDMNSNDILNVNQLDVQALTVQGLQFVPDEALVTDLPSPVGQDGKVLRSNNITASWQFLGKSDIDGLAGIQMDTVAAAKALSVLANGALVHTLGYRTKGDGGHASYEYDSGSSATVDAGQYHSLDTLSGRLKLLWDKCNAYLLQWGVYTDGTNAAFNTTQIQNAIIALRHDPQTILDTIGGSNITAYASGTVHFPAGQIAFTANSLEIRYDVGLKFKGTGSRRTNNSVRGSTVLVCADTSGGWLLRTYRSGGRGFTVEDMDITYSTSGFTGDVFDTIDSPGINFKRVYLGSNGISGATRLQTARSLLRATYDEFITCEQCVFDGAVDGWWSDDTRTELGNTFGGSVTCFKDCVWYDFTGNMVRHDGNRTRTGVVFDNCAWNPISVDCVRAIDMNNVDGLVFSGGTTAPSTANKPTAEWLRLVNCTGSINGVNFGDLAKAGTLNGQLSLHGNSIFCTDGFTLTGGCITASSNEFSKGTNGYYIDPVTTLTVKLGPDLFKAGVTYSYRIPADNALQSGFIDYDDLNDASANNFSNASPRICIRNVDQKAFTVAVTPYTPLITDTGRVIVASAGAAQVINLPESVPGTQLRIFKLMGFQLTVNCFAGDNFYVGIGPAKTVATFAAADIGGYIELEALSTVGWRVVSAVGTITWT